MNFVERTNIFRDKKKKTERTRKGGTIGEEVIGDRNSPGIQVSPVGILRHHPPMGTTCRYLRAFRPSFFLRISHDPPLSFSPNPPPLSPRVPAAPSFSPHTFSRETLTGSGGGCRGSLRPVSGGNHAETGPRSSIIKRSNRDWIVTTLDGWGEEEFFQRRWIRYRSKLKGSRGFSSLERFTFELRRERIYIYA